MSGEPVTEKADVVLIGAGVMSATMGTMVQQLEPTWTIRMFERLDRAGSESSDPWNNAGTGHSALCELNYTPQAKDGSVSADKALVINEQFQLSRQFWSHLLQTGVLADPKSFINPVAHMSLVFGEDHARYLKTRYEALKPNKLFETIEHSEDPDVIAQWAPLTMAGRPRGERVAASRVVGGTDVNFGELTRQLTAKLAENGAEVAYGHEVTDITRGTNGRWQVSVKNRLTGQRTSVDARFVFIGAGGGALHLLQRSGIPEGKGLAGFPVSGEFLRCTDPAIADQQNAKVYGQASVGAPPMSVPHLDTRFADGERSLLFGPYAGFSTKFLKTGTYLDLPLSIRTSNIVPMLAVAKDNMDLTKYLVTEVLKSRSAKDDSLRQFYPEADPASWELITAGQRVQVIKKDAKRGGVLQFGTELVTSSDGSIAALLGASPGASTATSIMIDLLKRSFPGYADRWASKLTEMIPSYGRKLNDDPQLADEVLEATNRALALA
ncbi:putative malate:quinone oxidoreductase 2 [Tersicoccus solisilvae]|uniref:Probable malate:quinone oxidoreductase n=1 Tax=Tersicoccus solisilvae TaxID=1882339 RepID=A0ABQ1PK38_9MICC|nr:malate:quinone oxidoreductase [Tersicoccus solisilvae]GGC98373.1 putative malate:quinone oxidoreductase 2 [Tersicoccus solisilvae]